MLHVDKAQLLKTAQPSSVEQKTHMPMSLFKIQKCFIKVFIQKLPYITRFVYLNQRSSPYNVNFSAGLIAESFGPD